MAAVVLLGASLLGVPERSWAAPAAPEPGAPVVVVDESVAVARAVASGRRVEVETLRDGHSLTFARPDGSFVTEATLRPQRVRRADGTWAPIDTRLRRNGDGTVSPVASTLDVRFSGGGSGAFAVMRDGGRQVGLRWPRALPEPVLSGDTATYRDVLPGVDLQVRADADSFTHLLVIRSAKAADNPAVARIALDTELSGVSLRTDPGTGVVSAVDSSGAVVFEGPTPSMWDSRVTAPVQASSSRSAGGKRPADDPPAPPVEPREGIVAAEVSAGRLTLVPDAAMLGDPRTVFPVFVDPTWTTRTASKTGWSVLRQTWPTRSYFKASSITDSDATYGVMRAGYSDWEDPTVRDRSLFSFDIKPFAYKHIYKATFSLTQQWTGATCGYGGQPRVELRWLKQGFSSSTTWNTGWNTSGSGWGEVLATSDKVHRVGHTSCAPRKAEFNVTNKVIQLVAKGTGGLNLGLRAKNESDRFSWKRFKNDAGLSIEYNTRPNAPKALKVANRPCASGTAAPWVLTATPTFEGTASDADGGQQTLNTRFYWWRSGQALNANDFVADGSANPGGASATVPVAKALVDHQRYVWRAQTFDDVNDATWAGTCEFLVDLFDPNPPSDIDSTSYTELDPDDPDGPGTGGVGLPGTLTIDAPASGASDVAAYAYSLTETAPTAQTPTVAANPGGPTTVTVRPVRDGVNKLHVWSKDQAGRFSTARTFEFRVKGGTGPAAAWTFDDAAARSADDTGHENTLTFVGATTTAGRGGVGSALALSGSNQYASRSAINTPHPDTGEMTPVVTNSTFTVSARVKLTAVGGTGEIAVVAADGTRTSAFQLSYDTATGKWAFAMAGTDGDFVAPTLAWARSDAPAVLNRWTHLAGVYDVATHQVRLYVNGVAQTATGTLTGGFNATAGWQVGRRKWNGVSVGYLNGAVDDVRVYSFAAAATTLQDHAKPLPPAVSFPGVTDAKVGDQVQVRFDTGGDTNVTAVWYSVGSGALDLPATAAGGGVFTATVNATAAGPMTVHAAAEAGALQGPAATAQIVVRALTVTWSGVVYDLISREPVVGAVVRLEPGDLTVTTGPGGTYSFIGIEPGDYVISASYEGACGLAYRNDVTIPSADSPDLWLTAATDRHGYACEAFEEPFAPATGGVVALTGDNEVAQVALPFPFPFYDTTYSSVWVDTNGIVTFVDPGGSHRGGATTIPSLGPPNAMVAAFWDDLVVDAAASVRTGLVESGPLRQFVIEWRNVHRFGDPSQRLSVTASLGEDGFVVLNYSGLDNDVEKGAEAAVGIESPGGEVGLQYSFQEPILASGRAVAFVPPDVPNPIELVDLSGTVTDAATGAAQPGAVVTVEETGRTVTADGAGNYSFADLEAGSYTVSAVQGVHCGKLLARDVDLFEPADVDLPLRPLADGYGNTCQGGPATFVTGNDPPLPLTGDDGKTQVTVPFPVWLYGEQYTTAWVDIDGLVAFAPYTGIPYQAHELPSPAQPNQPNAAVYAFWEDWVVDASASVRTGTVGTAPNRQFVVEWRNVHNWEEPSIRVSFAVVFHEGGDIQVMWKDIDPGSERERGSLGAVAIENADGTAALVHSFKEPAIAGGQSVRFTPGPAPIGDIVGTITCGGVAAGGVSVKVAGRTAVTAPDGTYAFADVPGGPYTVLATPGAGSGCYGTAGEPVTVSANLESTVDFALTGSTGTRYTATEGPRAFVPATGSPLPHTGDDGITQVTLPFPAKLYGQSYTTAWVATDGVLSFEQITNQPWDPWPLPSERDSDHPNTAVFPLWHDWFVDASASIRTGTVGTAPNRQYIVEWRDVVSLQDTTNTRVSFEVILHEQGDIEIVWDGVDANFYEQGGDATVGVENADATAAVQYTYRHPVIRNGRGLLLHPVTS